MEPNESLLLPSWEPDDTSASKKLTALYKNRMIKAVQSETQQMELLQSFFEMVEVTDVSDDVDWGKSALPFLEIEPEVWSLPEKAWEFLATDRFRKWKLPRGLRNSFLYDPQDSLSSLPLYFFLNTEKHHFFDSNGRFQPLFRYFRGIDPKSKTAKRVEYARNIEFINTRKARLVWNRTKAGLRQMTQSELILPDGTRKVLPQKAVSLLLCFLSGQNDTEMIDCREQPPAEYILRLFDSVSEYYLSGNQKYLYWHDFVRIRLEEFHPAVKHLNQKLKRLLKA